MDVGIDVKGSGNLCIVSGYTRNNPGWIQLGEMTDSTKLEYAKKWGYGFRSYWEGFDTTRPASWSKLLFIKEAFESYEWVFWVDADAAITNFNIDIGQYCKNKDFVIGLDYEGLNCGVFLLRRGTFAGWLIDTVWSMVHHINHVNWEQAAVKELYAKGLLKDNIETLPYKTINSFYRNTVQGKFEVGDFICHMSGMFNMNGRISGLSDVLSATKKAGLISVGQ